MIEWNLSDFERLTNAEIVKGLKRVGVYFVSKERGYLNTSQQYKRYGKRYKGMNPSSPGQFPHKLSGQLMRSVTYEVDETKLTMTAGSNLSGYPKFLETGTRFMRPRPWITLGFEKENANLGAKFLGR